MKLTAPTPTTVEYVISHMRDSDIAEVLALQAANIDLTNLLIQVWAAIKAGPLALVACGDDWLPIALIVFSWRTPTTVNGDFVATDAWPKIARPMTRHIREAILPELASRGVKRVECRTLAANDKARRWLAHLGLTHECDIPAYGAGGETYSQYAWSPSDVHRTDSSGDRRGAGSARRDCGSSGGDGRGGGSAQGGGWPAGLEESQERREPKRHNGAHDPAEAALDH